MTAPGIPEALQLARMLQFGDSMLPVGTFAFSSGLESAVQKGVVHDAASLLEYTRTMVAQAARGDAIALLCAHRAALADDVPALLDADRAVFARKLSSEARTMSVRIGRKYVELLANTTGNRAVARWLACIESGQAHGCYPVALGASFAALDLGAREAFVVHQYGVAATVLGAALRLMRIGHPDTQRMLFAINGSIAQDYERAAQASLDDMAGFAPMAEILASVHVHAHVRLFMN